MSDHHCTAVASQGILLSENHRTGLMEAVCLPRHQWPQPSASTIRSLGSGQLTLGTRVRLVPGKETPRISGSYSSPPSDCCFGESSLDPEGRCRDIIYCSFIYLGSIKLSIKKSFRRLQLPTMGSASWEVVSSLLLAACEQGQTTLRRVLESQAVARYLDFYR